jgi:hypothetical protein
MYIELTVLDLGHLSTDFAQNFTSPSFALTQILTATGQSRTTIGFGGHAQFGGLGLPEPVQHRLSFFFISCLKNYSKHGLEDQLEFTTIGVEGNKELGFTMMSYPGSVRCG